MVQWPLSPQPPGIGGIPGTPQGLTKNLGLFLASTACSGFPGKLILPCRFLGAAPCRPHRLVASGAPDKEKPPQN